MSRRTQMTRPNSVATNYTYDNLSRLLSVLHQISGSTIDGASYTVDSAGNRTAKTDQLAAVTSNYAYDAIYQLTQVTQAATTTESFSYDPVGNRTASLGVSSYTTNASNELTATPGVSYTYDSNGNTLTKSVGSNTTTYAWDFENRLTSVTLPGSSGTVSFKYDPLGRRIYKSSSASTSIYAYDEDNLVEETNASGGVVARYSQGQSVDEPLAMLRSSATSYYNADGLGSVTSLTNASGAAAETYTYNSFGNVTASAGSLVNPFQYTGREFDAETGLYFYRARFYDPATGRFLSEDPIRFEGSGPNFYNYVGNDVTGFVDPWGLQHSDGGPLHQPQGVQIACTWDDDCSTISGKIDWFKRIIASHVAWDAANNTNRHANDITNLQNGLNNCILIHTAKCTNKNPCKDPAPNSNPIPVPSLSSQRSMQAVNVIGVIGIIVIIALSPVGL